MMPASFKPKPLQDKPQLQKSPRASSKQPQLPAAYQVKVPVAKMPTAQPVKQERGQTQLTLKQEGNISTERPALVPKPLKRGRSGDEPAAEERPWYRPRWCVHRAALCITLLSCFVVAACKAASECVPSSSRLKSCLSAGPAMPAGAARTT